MRVGYSANRPWNIVFRSRKPIEAVGAYKSEGKISLVIAAGLDGIEQGLEPPNHAGLRSGLENDRRGLVLVAGFDQ